MGDEEYNIRPSRHCFRCGESIFLPLDENLIIEREDNSCIFFCSLECKITWNVKAEIKDEIELEKLENSIRNPKEVL